MLSLLKKLFGVKPAEQPVEVPYKVEVAPEVKAEAPPAVVETPPVVAATPQPKKKPAGRKPTGPKPVQKQSAPKQGAPKKGGRKPRSKPQV
jgi:hypothetical protein